jgi:hypothetical protein
LDFDRGGPESVVIRKPPIERPPRRPIDDADHRARVRIE